MESPEEVIELLKRALKDMFDSDESSDLIRSINNTSERNITSHLRRSLEKEIREIEFLSLYQVDQEYGAYGTRSSLKERSLYPSESKNMIPDIIIHKRGKNNNFLAVEIKKKKGMISSKNLDWRTLELDKDLRKLEEYKEGKYLYKYVAILVFAKNGVFYKNSMEAKLEMLFDL